MIKVQLPANKLQNPIAYNVFYDLRFTQLFKVIQCFWRPDEDQRLAITNQLLQMVEVYYLLTCLACSAFKRWPSVWANELVPV